MKLAFLFLLIVSLSAQAEDLAHSQEWLRLLHMRKSLWGDYESSVRGQGFFLSQKGMNDPLAELTATRNAMFGVDTKLAKQVQCRFLARRDFLLRHGPSEWKTQVQSCEFSEEWLQKLNVTKISLVFASAYMNSAASSFGHTFLKLQNPENTQNKDLLNYGVNFSARTSETSGALYALYGLTGNFPGAFAMIPYHQMIKDYTHLEGRDIWEYELDLTQEEVQRILFHLLELDKVYFEYYFLDDNCSYAILKLIQIGRPSLNLVDQEEPFVIPLDTVKKVQPLVRAIHYRQSLSSEWRSQYQQLSLADKNAVSELLQRSTPDHIQNLSTEALMAAQHLIALKSGEDQNQWQDLNYQLGRERSKRKEAAAEKSVDRPSFSPEQGPHSSAVEIGQLESRNSSALFGIRAAFHDQLSRNVGVSPFSHLEVLGFHWQTRDPNQLFLRKYRILEMLSTEAINIIERPISWGVLVGGTSNPTEPTRLYHELSGRIGYSFDLLPDQFRWTHLLHLGLQEDQDRQIQIVPGFNSRLWLIWHPKVRSLLQFEVLRFRSENQRILQAAQAFDLNHQLELRIGWREFEENRKLAVEKTISLYQSFLF